MRREKHRARNSNTTLPPRGYYEHYAYSLNGLRRDVSYSKLTFGRFCLFLFHQESIHAMLAESASNSSTRFHYLVFVFMPAMVVLKHSSRACCHIHVAVRWYWKPPKFPTALTQNYNFMGDLRGISHYQSKKICCETRYKHDLLLGMGDLMIHFSGESQRLWYLMSPTSNFCYHSSTSWINPTILPTKPSERLKFYSSISAFWMYFLRKGGW